MSFVKNIDPMEFARRFSGEDRLTVDSDRIKLRGSLDQVKELLVKIPEKEVDLIYMYYILGKGQKQMARILGITQGAVSLRLRKAIKRLQFLVNLPKVDVVEMTQDLFLLLNNGVPKYWCRNCHKEYEGFITQCSSCFSSTLIENVEITIMTRMFETSCQSVVAREVGLSQCGVRHRFLRNLKKIEIESKKNLEFKKYFDSLKMISENLNILREVEVPRWKRERNIVLSDVSSKSTPSF